MITLDDCYIAAPNDAQGFIYVSEQMLVGAETIAETSQSQAHAVTHMCGHAVETSLKAILSDLGVSSTELRKNSLGHKLVALWHRSYNEGGLSSGSIPKWLSELDAVHSAPYRVRYPLGFHTIVLPNQNAMLIGARELFVVAKEAIKN